MAEREGRVAMGASLLVAGAFIGAGLALLFAPQSGKDTRHDIARYARRARRKTDRAIGEFAETVSEMVETVGGKAEEILDRGKDLAREAKDELIAALETGRDRMEEQRARLLKRIS